MYMYYQVVTKHYPGEFGDEQIVQQVVEMLLSATESKSSEQVEHHGPNDDDNKPMETGLIILVHVHQYCFS